MKEPTWIVVEGLDGSGKTTAIQILARYYQSIGKNVAITKAIGSGQIGEFLRTKIVTEEYTDSLMNTVAFPLAIMDCIYEVFRLSNANDVIITDRFLGSYYAYEDSNNDLLVTKLINHVNEYISTLISSQPIQVFIDSDVQTCLARVYSRGNMEFTDNGTESDFMRTLFRFGEYYKNKEYIRVDNNSDLATFEQLLLNRVTQ